MNVIPDRGNAAIDTEFVKFCQAQGHMSLRGYRIRGGMRAPIENAMPLTGVEALVTAMREFEATSS